MQAGAALAARSAAAEPLRGVANVESCKACLGLPHFGQVTFSFCERTIFS